MPKPRPSLKEVGGNAGARGWSTLQLLAQAEPGGAETAADDDDAFSVRR